MLASSMRVPPASIPCCEIKDSPRFKWRGVQVDDVRHFMGKEAVKRTIDFASLGLEGHWLVRDLWRQKDLGVYSVQYAADVPGHATHLVRLFPREDGRLADRKYFNAAGEPAE